MNIGVECKWTLEEESRSGYNLSKATEYETELKSITATWLLVIRQASYKGQELYLGLITELGNLHIDDRLLLKQSRENADSQREMYNRFTLEAEYRCDMQGRTDS